MGTWWLSSGQQELGFIGPLGLDEGACDLLRGEFVGSAGWTLHQRDETVSV